jgi:hypothetical protein
MTTTISIRVAGKPGTGRGGDGSGGNNPRFGLRAKLATGVAILGCAAALTLGGVWIGNAAQTPSQPAPRATLLPAGTDDLATTHCIGNTGPFACRAGQSLVGTDDFATNGCVGSMGPFTCGATLPAANNGTDDLATNACIGTVGPFACPADDHTQP